MAAAKNEGNFTKEEKAAMREAAAERRRQALKTMTPADFEAEVVEKIEAMSPDDRAIAEKLHALVKKIAPELEAKTWYGMPAYNRPKGKSIFFFQDAGKFKARYSTLGFSDLANLDDGKMWPNSYALVEWNAAVEKQITELIKQALA